MANLKAFDVSSSYMLLAAPMFSTPLRNEAACPPDVWVITGDPQKIQGMDEGAIDKYDAASADIVYQRYLDGKEKVYSSEEMRKILGLED